MTKKSDVIEKKYKEIEMRTLIVYARKTGTSAGMNIFDFLMN